MKIIEVPEFRPRWELATCTAETSVREAANLMSERNVGALPVVEGDRLVGILSERDLIRRLIAQGLEAEATPVSEVMTREVVTARPSDTVRHVTQTMLKQGFRHMPVADEKGELIGILSLRDFMAVTWGQLFERSRRHALMGLTSLVRRQA